MKRRAVRRLRLGQLELREMLRVMFVRNLGKKAGACIILGQNTAESPSGTSVLLRWLVAFQTNAEWP